MALLIVLSGLVYAAFGIFWVNNAENDLLRSDLVNQTQGLRTALEGREIADHDALAKNLAASTGTRVTFIAGDGAVLGDSSAVASTLPNHSNRQEVIQAKKAGIGTSARYSATQKIDEMYCAVVMRDGETILRLSIPAARVDNAVFRVWGGVLIASAIILAVSVAVAFGLASKVAGPIRRITQGALDIAGGKYDTRISSRHNDEIGKLADAFNVMAGRLGESVRELESEKATLMAVLSSMQDGVVAVDERMHLLFLNESAKRLLEAHDAMVGRHFVESIRSKPLQDIFRTSLEHGQTVSVEMESGLTDSMILRLSSSPIQGKGRVVGAVALVQDITQVRRLENMRSEFVANVSHELKTPLTSIKGFAQTLMDNPVDDKTKKKYLTIIDNEAERLKNLINDILTLSLIESEKKGVAVKTTSDAVKCAQNVLEMMKPLAEVKNISLVLNTGEKHLLVPGQKDRIQQMLINLVDNAVKFTPEGGHVEIAILREGQKAFLRVSDTGIGIPRSHLPRIFERFYRVDSSRSRELGGTGLGLSIVKHISLSLGGETHVESDAGKGAVFTITLPVVEG